MEEDKRKFVFEVVESYQFILEADNQDEALMELASMTPKQRIERLQTREIKVVTGL